MTKKSFLLGSVAGVLIAVGVLAFLFRPTGGTAVERSEAVDEFRRRSPDSTEKADRSPKSPDGASGDVAGDKAGAIPGEGIYTYSAVGQEDVKLGPLPAETRSFPSQVVASVMATPPVNGADSASSAANARGKGCFDFKLNLIAEHTETTRYCLDGDALRIDQHSKTIKIGPMSATATLKCDPSIRIDADAAVDTRACKLNLAGGPVSVDTDLEGSTQIGDATQIDVAGSRVEVAPVTITYVAAGSVSGNWTERFWMSTSDWLPVRIERDISLVGPATIKENSKLNLTSLTPEI